MSGNRVLIMDDDPRVCRLFKRVAEGLGFEAFAIDNSSQFESGRRRLKIVLTTGFSKGQRDARPDYADVFPVLKKPYSKEELAHQIRAALDTQV